MKRFPFTFLFSLAVFIAFSSSLYAFEWKSGKKVFIESNENIEDDLYITAEEIVVDGNIDGDLVVFGQDIIVNGVVNGSLIGAGRSIIVNGTVKGNVRTASASLLLNEKAQIEKDIVSAGAGLDIVSGAKVRRDVIFAGAAVRVSGNIDRDLRVAGAGVEINGNIGRHVIARVGEMDDGMSQTYSFIWSSGVSIPSVKTGITIAPKASVVGDLHYSQSRDLSFPNGVIGGEIVRKIRSLMETPLEDSKGSWVLDFARNLIALIIVGLLLTLLFYRPLSQLVSVLRENPGQCLLWGFVSVIAFIFSLITILIATLFLAIVLGLLTLQGLAASALLAGLLLNFVLIFAFYIIVSYVAIALVGITVGEWLLGKVSLANSTNRFLAVLVGVPIVFLAVEGVSLLPIIGWLGSCIVAFVGLGALWLRIRDSKKASH